MEVGEFKVDLYRHQYHAIDRMHNGCILVGGVGSGKSRTALVYYMNKELGIGSLDTDVRGGEYVYTYYVDIRKFKEPRKLYIITTARKRDTCDWELEGIPFGLYGYTDYSSIELIVDSWNNIKKYVDVTDAFFIFDEQRVVGYGTWTKSFLKITKNNHWILLSATPGDNWMDYMPVFIANGFYKNKTDFTSRHAVFSRFSRYPKIERFVEEQRLERLRRSILVEMAFKRDTVSFKETVISKYDRDKYKTILKDRWNPDTNEPLKDANEVCIALRKLVNTDPDKILKFKSLMHDHAKAVVFYNFNVELELLRKACDEMGLLYSEWNGHNHEPIPTTDRWAYLVQYNAGAEGWNCITTDTMIFYSQNYSYKTMEQARGRIDRANTPFKELHYYHMRTNSSIDRSIEMAINRKKTFNEKAFLKR